MGWHVMNNSNGTLNIARLIEEAEAQLMAEHNSSCRNCGNCKGERSHFSGQCKQRDTKHVTHRPLVTTGQR